MSACNVWSWYVLLLVSSLPLFITGCRDQGRGYKDTIESDRPTAAKNLLSGISNDNVGELKWINPPEKFELHDGTLTITAENETDFFINPVDLTSTASAHLLYKKISGDFVAITAVKPDMSSQWNAAALMAVIDDTHWIKFGFENSDATGPGIVTVVTKNTSDDANGPILKNTDRIWLKLVRKDHNFSMHWSYDGNSYYMARLAAMPEADSVIVGIEAQCPVGSEAVHSFEHFSIEPVRVEDIRKGE
ncbi:MAG: DUF1349 domain-containing protein [Flavobacteriaceae bacterium]